MGRWRILLCIRRQARLAAGLGHCVVICNCLEMSWTVETGNEPRQLQHEMHSSFLAVPSSSSPIHLLFRLIQVYRPLTQHHSYAYYGLKARHSLTVATENGRLVKVTTVEAGEGNIDVKHPTPNLVSTGKEQPGHKNTSVILISAQCKTRSQFN